MARLSTLLRAIGTIADKPYRRRLLYRPLYRRRYDALMDEYLEESYQSWKQRQRMRGDVVKKKRKRLGDDGELR